MHFIAILGFWNHPDGQLSEPIQVRLELGLKLYQEKPGSLLIVSGGFGDNFNTSSRPHAEYLKEYLMSKGVVESNIVVLSDPPYTVAEASAISDYLGDKSFEHLWIVTSEFHAARVEIIFKHFFAPNTFSVVPAPNRGMDPEDLAVRIAHEKEQIALIKEQGGIIVDGRLLKTA